MTIQDIKLALQCGLQVVLSENNEEGLEFIGNDEEWKSFKNAQELFNQK